MKLITEEQLNTANDIFLTEGTKGGLLTLIGTTGAIIGLTKYRPTPFLTLPIKAFIICSLTTAGFVISGEHALIDYDRKVHAHLRPDHLENATKLTPVTEVSPLEKWRDWVGKHRYQLLGASWVLGMTASGYYLYRKKYLTTQQKLVEARMYAQGITLASLAAVAAISSGPKRTFD